MIGNTARWTEGVEPPTDSELPEWLPRALRGLPPAAESGAHARTGKPKTYRRARQTIAAITDTRPGIDEVRRWTDDKGRVRIFVVDTRGEYEAVEVRADEIDGFPAFCASVAADTDVCRLRLDLWRVSRAAVLSVEGRAERAEVLLARLRQLSEGRPLFDVYDNAGGAP